jgi:hypothetical protein
MILVGRAQTDFIQQILGKYYGHHSCSFGILDEFGDFVN